MLGLIIMCIINSATRKPPFPCGHLGGHPPCLRASSVLTATATVVTVYTGTRPPTRHYLHTHSLHQHLATATVVTVYTRTHPTHSRFAYAFASTHLFIHTFTSIRTCSHPHFCSTTYSHPHTHTNTLAHIHSHRYVFTSTHWFTHSRIHIHTYVFT